MSNQRRLIRPFPLSIRKNSLAEPARQDLPLASEYESDSIKVLKGLAEYLDLSLGDLLEGILLHAFEQKAPFDDRTIKVIDQLKLSIKGVDAAIKAANKAQKLDKGGD